MIFDGVEIIVSNRKATSGNTGIALAMVGKLRFFDEEVMVGKPINICRLRNAEKLRLRPGFLYDIGRIPFFSGVGGWKVSSDRFAD